MAEHDSTEEANTLNQAQTDQFTSFAGKRFSLEEWNAINQPVIDQFHANNGTIVEGLFKGAPVLLLTTTGARNGKAHVTPLTYTRAGNRYVVLASKLGAPEHPAWYHNLVANPVVTVEVGPERFQARASVVARAARRRPLPDARDHARRPNDSNLRRLSRNRAAPKTRAHLDRQFPRVAQRDSIVKQEGEN